MITTANRFAPLLALALAMSACGGDDSEESVAGPCVHLYQDEVLQLESASGRDTGAVIPELRLRDFSVDGAALSIDEVIAQRSSSVQRDGDVLRCVLPCGFGVQEGEWTFAARAEGYAWTGQVVEARYAVTVGGCPSYSDEGTEASIQLDEAGG